MSLRWGAHDAKGLGADLGRLLLDLVVVDVAGALALQHGDQGIGGDVARDPAPDTLQRGAGDAAALALLQLAVIEERLHRAEKGAHDHVGALGLRCAFAHDRPGDGKEQFSLCVG